MVNTSTHKLLTKLYDVQKYIKRKDLKSDEKLALVNYIFNIYQALICLGDTSISFNKKELFGSDKIYDRSIKRVNYYSDKLVNNYFLNKKYHKNYLGEILLGVEQEIDNMKDYKGEETTFSRNDYFDIIRNFMKSIKQEDLFDKLYKNGNIYSTIVGQSDGHVGFTLYNPLNKDKDIFVKDIRYTLDDMNTLVHELGHVYDSDIFDNNIEKYNSYLYLSFNVEVMSRLFERLFFKYLYDHNIKRDIVIDKQIEFSITNHEILFQAFILSLLNNNFLLEDKQIECDSSEIMEMINGIFIDDDIVKNFIDRTESFDLSEVYNYAYGDIISLFLFNEINKYGFDNEMMNYFYKNRHELFNEKYFRECGFGPENYVKLYKKATKHLKKQL